MGFSEDQNIEIKGYKFKKDIKCKIFIPILTLNRKDVTYFYSSNLICFTHNAIWIYKDLWDFEIFILILM